MRRALIPLAALCAILPLLLTGPSCGHDFDFHLLNWLEAQTQLAHLQYPHWAFTPAWNAGEPRFLFYPPISWLLGAALTAILPFQYVATAFTWLALTLAGFSLHRLARPYVSPNAATLAAVLYLLNPYMLFTAYERTAYAELLAAAIIPLLFAAILAPRPTISGIALPVTLLWLTNAPAAVMASYALALLTLVRLIHPIRPVPHLRDSLIVAKVGIGEADPPTVRLAITSLLGTTLGLLLAAFYILPAAYERRFVAITMAVIPGMAPADNFLFHHTGLSEDALAHDQVLHTASLIALLLITLTAAALLAVYFTRSRARCSLLPHPSSLLLPFTILTATITLLLTPISLPIWTHTPQLAFLQFPWRLLALLAPILALTISLILPTLRSRTTLLLSAALVATLIPTAWHTFHQTCDLPDTPLARAALFHSPHGTEPTDEYTPLDADPDALHPEDPPSWLLPPTSPIDAPAPTSLYPGPTPNHLTATGPGTLILNRRQYPFWRITLNHHPATSLPRTDGLYAIPLPPGPNTIDLTLTRTPDESIGLALSLVASIILLALRIRHPLHSSGAESIQS